MKAIIKAALLMIIIGTIPVFPVVAQERDNPGTETTIGRTGGVKSLEKRINHLEETIGRQVGGDKGHDRLRFSGLIEIETGHGKTDYRDPATADETGSDVDLSAAELLVDAKIAAQVDGHVMLKYEEHDLFVDEAFITLTGTGALPAYLTAGRQYIPFGYYDSHFISDPATLVLGETNNGSVIGSCRFNGEVVDIFLGAFNGRVKEIGENDTIANVVGAVVVSLRENITFGASYTSNLASSDALSEMVTDLDGDGESDNISGFVGGWSAFFTASVMERFKVIAEYVAAVDEFKAGELFNVADTENRQPAAWNLELGFAINDAWEVAIRYEGSNDRDAGGGEFLPESQYGAVVNWGLFARTNLAIEYLHSEFHDDFQKVDVFTAQLAVEF